MADMLARLLCAMFDHRLDGPDINSVCGQWAFRDCQRCGRLVTIRRPPPVTVVHRYTVTTEIVPRTTPEGESE